MCLAGMILVVVLLLFILACATYAVVQTMGTRTLLVQQGDEVFSIRGTWPSSLDLDQPFTVTAV